MSKRLTATRQELMQQKATKKMASRGHKLLKDKRDGLMKQFMEVIREAVELRKRVELRYAEMYREFELARVMMDEDYLNVLAETPSTRIFLERKDRNIMSVIIPLLKVQVEGHFLNYSLLQTNPHLDQALHLLRELLPYLLQMMEKENAAKRLAEEIEKTRRRVNGLEYVIIPQMEENIAYIEAALDEMSRETTVSLIKMKEMLAG